METEAVDTTRMEEYPVKCHYCEREASAKIGTARGNIFNALFGRKAWDKMEVYVCERHFKEKGGKA